MASIVQELQREPLSKQVPITDLLRKALVVARKLKVREFESWIQQELDGYAGATSDEIPKYRELKGTPQVWNPYHGWQPIMFQSSKEADALSIRTCGQPISEIEHMIDEHKPGGHFEMPFPGEVAHKLMKAIGMNLQPSLHISAATISRIRDSVRNIVLNWALKLEEDGILGSEISFSANEVEKAEKANYTINNFNGNLVNTQVQQNSHGSTQTLDAGVDKAALEVLLKAVQTDIGNLSKLSVEQRSDIEAELATVKAQLQSSRAKPSIIKESLISIREFLIIAGADLTAAAIHGYLTIHGML
ncbi:MAG: AbiTii domain-containing protein [Pseudobdellovibrionaceae bacterium]